MARKTPHAGLSLFYLVVYFFTFTSLNLVNVSLYPCEDTSDGRTNGFGIL